MSPPPEPGLSARVWLDKEMTQIGLAMARSIGDHAVKGIGVIAEPEITQHTLGPDDDFMILVRLTYTINSNMKQSILRLHPRCTLLCQSSLFCSPSCLPRDWFSLMDAYRSTAILVLDRAITRQMSRASFASC